jgi:hypothetical protein
MSTLLEKLRDAMDEFEAIQALHDHFESAPPPVSPQVCNLRSQVHKFVRDYLTSNKQERYQRICAQLGQGIELSNELDAILVGEIHNRIFGQEGMKPAVALEALRTSRSG